MYGFTPKCIRSCAFRDLSLGNTRLQYLHFIFDGESFPSIIKFVRVSLLGRPRFDDDEDRGDILELEGEGTVKTISSCATGGAGTEN